MKFRAKSVLALPLEKRAKYLLRLPNVTDAIAARALVNYHLERQRPMMGAFLDALGIAHENGLISEEDVDQARRPTSCAPRPTELAAKYPAEDVALYLSTLVSQDPETWGRARRAAADEGGELEPPATPHARQRYDSRPSSRS